MASKTVKKDAKVAKTTKKVSTVKNERVVYAEEFGKRLREKIEKKGMTQRDFAVAMGVTPVAVTHWLKDGRIPNGYYINKMCDVLKVSADFLLGRKK